MVVNGEALAEEAVDDASGMLLGGRRLEDDDSDA
jgi:hypothetical protein